MVDCVATLHGVKAAPTSLDLLSSDARELQIRMEMVDWIR
jgi:hypothetical protein